MSESTDERMVKVTVRADLTSVLPESYYDGQSDAEIRDWLEDAAVELLVDDDVEWTFTIERVSA